MYIIYIKMKNIEITSVICENKVFMLKESVFVTSYNDDVYSNKLHDVKNVLFTFDDTYI